MLNLRNFCKSATIGGLTFLLAPFPNPISGLVYGVAPSIASQLEAQKLRPRAEPPNVPAPVTNTQAPAAPQPSAPVSPTTQPASQAPAAASSGLPASMLEEPAKPAQIAFAQDTLSIHADNSSLDQILHSLETQSGMKVDGLGHDERVFGSFGPGNPREVISDLLNGTPYNVLMVGDQSNGAPSRLILTPVDTAPAPQASTPAQPSPQPANEDNGGQNGNPQPGSPFPGPRPGSPPPQPGTPGVKSPQALFEELQAMRQRQQQQQQQAPQ